MLKWDLVREPKLLQVIGFFREKIRPAFKKLSELLFLELWSQLCKFVLCHFARITRYIMISVTGGRPYDRENSKKFHPLQWCFVRMRDENGSTSGADKTSETLRAN